MPPEKRANRHRIDSTYAYYIPLVMKTQEKVEMIFILLYIVV